MNPNTSAITPGSPGYTSQSSASQDKPSRKGIFFAIVLLLVIGLGVLAFFMYGKSAGHAIFPAQIPALDQPANDGEYGLYSMSIDPEANVLLHSRLETEVNGPGELVIVAAQPVVAFNSLSYTIEYDPDLIRVDDPESSLSIDQHVFAAQVGLLSNDALILRLQGWADQFDGVSIEDSIVINDVNQPIGQFINEQVAALGDGRNQVVQNYIGALAVIQGEEVVDPAIQAAFDEQAGEVLGIFGVLSEALVEDGIVAEDTVKNSLTHFTFTNEPGSLVVTYSNEDVSFNNQPIENADGLFELGRIHFTLLQDQESTIRLTQLVAQDADGNEVYITPLNQEIVVAPTQAPLGVPEGEQVPPEEQPVENVVVPVEVGEYGVYAIDVAKVLHTTMQIQKSQQIELNIVGVPGQDVFSEQYLVEYDPAFFNVDGANVVDTVTALSAFHESLLDGLLGLDSIQLGQQLEIYYLGLQDGNTLADPSHSNPGQQIGSVISVVVSTLPDDYVDIVQQRNTIMAQLENGENVDLVVARALQEQYDKDIFSPLGSLLLEMEYTGVAGVNGDNDASVAILSALMPSHITTNGGNINARQSSVFPFGYQTDEQDGFKYVGSIRLTPLQEGESTVRLVALHGYNNGEDVFTTSINDVVTIQIGGQENVPVGAAAEGEACRTSEDCQVDLICNADFICEQAVNNGNQPPVAGAVDTDGDGILDAQDNCPLLANPLEDCDGDVATQDVQCDINNDGVGDACVGVNNCGIIGHDCGVGFMCVPNLNVAEHAQCVPAVCVADADCGNGFVCNVAGVCEAAGVNPNAAAPGGQPQNPVAQPVVAPNAPQQGGNGGGGGGGRRCVSDWSCTYDICRADLTQVGRCVDRAGCAAPKQDVRACVPCVESWRCDLWTDCVNGVQSRGCVDDHLCGTYESMPDSQRQCVLDEQGMYVAPLVEDRSVNQPPRSTTPRAAATVKPSTSGSFWTTGKLLAVGIPGILVVVAILVLLVHHHQQKKQPSFNYEDLTKWVAQEKSMGTSNQDIENILHDHTGWSKEEIEKKFTQLGGTSGSLVVQAGIQPPVQPSVRPPVQKP